MRSTFRKNQHLALVFVLALWIGGSLAGCQPEAVQKPLPILGPREFVDRIANGQTFTDTSYHQISDFRFVNQDSQWVSQANFAGKVYVADFFFTRCPTICPIMTGQLMRVYQAWEGHPAVGILSHSIDPANDSVPVLRQYAKTIGANSQQWHLVTGEQEALHQIGLTQYLVTVKEDAQAPGGLLHSGAFVLVDKEKRIRGVYDGTSKEKTDQLIADIGRLLKE